MVRNNYVSTEDMILPHKEITLEMLCTRRKSFMFNSMFKYSKDITNVNINRLAMELRGRPKVKMKLPHSLKERVLPRLYHSAVDVWSQLHENVQKMDCVRKYKKQLKLMDMNMIKFGVKE